MKRVALLLCLASCAVSLPTSACGQEVEAVSGHDSVVVNGAGGDLPSPHPGDRVRVSRGLLLFPNERAAMMRLSGSRGETQGHEPRS